MSKIPIDTSIEIRKNITIYGTIAGLGSFTRVINIDFIPHEVIVKGIQYATPLGAEPNMYLLYSDLISDTLSPFYQNLSISTNPHFILNKQIWGNYNFQVNDINGIIDLVAAGEIVIQLEFVRYKEVKQERIL